MSPGDFLRSVWPSEGLFCLAQKRPSGSWFNQTRATIDEIVELIPTLKGDVFFTIHTLVEPNVPHLTEPGKTQVRVQRNTKAAKCFFFDIDVNPKDPEKYDTQGDALVGLKEFCAAVKIPLPMIVSSGNGLHVYWLLTEVIPSEEWRDHAARLRQLALHYGLLLDTSRTTDTASVLRVAGTFNHKDPDDLKPVKVLKLMPVNATGVFCKALHDAVIVTGELPATAAPIVRAESLFGSNTAMPYDGPRPSLDAVTSVCAQMRWLRERKGDFKEPAWYYAAIGVGRFTEDGHRRVHQLSQGVDRYNEAVCNAKIKQSEAVQSAPSSCATVAFNCLGDKACVGCKFAGKVFGPIQAAAWVDSAPPPVVEEKVGDEIITLDIPEAPEPFIRLKDGKGLPDGIGIKTTNADGDEIHQKIYDYDLYPVRRLTNTGQGLEQQVWHVELPRGEAKDFTLDADAIYDTRKFMVAVSNQGVYPNKGHISHLQEYMVAYISQLQKLVDADAQCNHLGWADDHSKFILPDKILYRDGTVKAAQLSLGAQRASAQVFRKGSAAKQIELFQFYNDPAYIPHQYYILSSLASILLYATGHHGLIVNASGAAGASKSTSLYAAASFWGAPELYPINGTNNGATVRGRNERVTVLANLPICVDEITHMPVKEAVDLAMSITQPGHRIRLSSDGVERASLESTKATIMLATANNSLHGMLSTDNTAGTAGSMRVFEILFRANNVREKHEADEFLRQLKLNFGHIGEMFVRHVLANQAAVEARVHAKMREIDEAAGIQASERFWSADIAVTLVAGELCQEMGLLPFETRFIRRWALDIQIPYMRGVVKEEYSDPLAVLADYLEMTNHNTLVTQHMAHGNLGGEHIVTAPSGPLLSHFDQENQLLFVLKKGFKDYCVRIGANPLKILDDLSDASQGKPVVCAKHAKRTLGSGTKYAKGQSWCFVIAMDHPDITGKNLALVKPRLEAVAPDREAS